ncbi:LysE family translocator [Streptomyces sp. NPDC020875]|uniref:LysE family translocator n=1 Tax=Streptomyces sp. NPDC020875 TaxID=3154898 RepID=UPI003406187D
MEWHQLLGFVIAIVPVTLTPGTSFTLVTQQVIAGTRADGVRVAFGTACGLLIHATFAAVGLSALVMSSARALTVVKIVGGLYLVWLGVSTWRSARRSAVPPEDRPRPKLPWNRLGSFGQGLFANLLNPRAAWVYLTLVPQFLTAGRPLPPQIAALSVAHVIVVLGWLLFWASVVAGARGAIDTPRIRLWIARVAGTVLVALGVRTATTA